MVLPLDLVEGIAKRLQKILIGGDDRAVHIELDDGLRLINRFQFRNQLFNIHIIHGSSSLLISVLDAKPHRRIIGCFNTRLVLVP